ncbi:MAG TPA: 5'-3' exonuclease H3TH domain-containing protein [Solirubrobacteraceae bacterium]|nr:5'-3' exonuclease H3TH domain-containing protein [Solirubrobacteraceae bacterium]
MPGPLLVVDAPSLMYRAFFALPQSITDADGHPVNALLGMANLVLFVVERHAPRAVVLCWGAEKAAYRAKLYEPYHADRPPMPPELEHQWIDAPGFFGAFGWTSISDDELEADDLLGSLAQVEADAGGSVLIFTGDRDMYQCVGDAVTVLFPRGGKDGPEVVDAAEVRVRYGIEPAQVPDFIALRGDPSDGLPGAKGIGAKTARDLLREHGTLEDVIAAARRPGNVTPRQAGALTGDPGLLLAFKDIATLRTVEVERPPDGPLDGEGAAAAARERGMSRLAERLATMA